MDAGFVPHPFFILLPGLKQLSRKPKPGITPAPGALPFYFSFRDYVFDKQSKSHHLTVAILGAPPSRRRVDGECFRPETRRRDASAPRPVLPVRSRLLSGKPGCPDAGVTSFRCRRRRCDCGCSRNFPPRPCTMSPADGR